MQINLLVSIWRETLTRKRLKLRKNEDETFRSFILNSFRWHNLITTNFKPFQVTPTYLHLRIYFLRMYFINFSWTERILKVSSTTKWQILKMCHLRHKLRILLFRRKVIFRRYSSFCIFNHPMIYQICDVIKSISTWDRMHFWISFEPRLIKSPNLVKW